MDIWDKSGAARGSLWEALALPPEEVGSLTLVGGGGKTSLMLALAREAAARGLQVGMKHFGQILEMEIRLYWWHAAVIAGTVLLCGACGAGGLATGLILLTEGAVLRYLVGSYNALAEAGLFRTLLAGE